MVKIQTVPVTDKELKVGNVLSFPQEQPGFWKITEAGHCKTGKHGAAKTIMSCRNLLNGKNRKVVYPGTDEMVHVTDMNYTFYEVQMLEGSEMVVNMDTGETIHPSHFATQSQFVEEELKKMLNGDGLSNPAGESLCVKCSELADGSLYFWDFFYSKPEDMSKFKKTEVLSA